MEEDDDDSHGGMLMVLVRFFFFTVSIEIYVDKSAFNWLVVMLVYFL